MKPVARRGYLLTVLAVILAFNYSDRLALGIALQNIKSALSLTDAQLGLLSGIAFAFFYAVMGIPIARWADRGNRVVIIASTAALWGVAVALCGAVRSFAQLLMIRVAVAVGEAGSIPSAMSLISDYFGRAERARAVAIYMLGIPLSLIFGYLWAGWLDEFYGWRWMFVMVGLPGLGLAALALATLREPRRLRPPSQALPLPRNAVVWAALWGNATYRHMLLSWAVSFFFSCGIVQWQPAFFIRSYGLSTGQIGAWFGVVYGVSGLLGTYLGGMLSSRYMRDDERRQLHMVAVCFCCAGALLAGLYLSAREYVGLAFLGLSTLLITLTNGPFLSIIEAVVEPSMRATAVALIFLFANLIGLGLGPLAVGILSDALRPVVGAESLRYALLALCPGFLWAAWYTWRASRTVGRDMQVVCAAPDTSTLVAGGQERSDGCARSIQSM